MNGRISVYLQFSVILLFLCMNVFTWLIVRMCEDLDKFQLFLFYDQVQVCIVSARSALTKSVLTHKIIRDNMNFICARSA
jgi:hypothetical protein